MNYPTTGSAYRAISVRDNAHINYWAGRFAGLWITQLTQYEKDCVIREYTIQRLER